MRNNVNLLKLPAFIKQPWVLFIIFTLIGAACFFLRFPNNFLEPNFYAEDATVFLSNIRELGFIQALMTTFNGYFVSGLYLIEGVGYIINFALFQNDFLDLARSFAIASYVFLGAVCALPFLLFKKHLPFAALLVMFALSVFVPLPSFDYAIIGTIGNSKFIFLYIAFLLLIYRHLLPEKSWRQFIAIDVILLICAYTNITVYLLLLFGLVRYIPLIRKWNIKELLKLRSIQSFIGLGILLVIQLIVIKINGITPTPGYLDTPYESSATVHLFLFRSYLFPVFYPIMKVMNDVLVIFAFAGVVASLWVLLKQYRTILIFALISVFVATFLFVMNRTGVSDFFLNYSSSGPDQFFYTQNLIMCFVIGLAVALLVRKITSLRIRLGVWAVLIVFFVVGFLPFAGNYGRNGFMQETVKNIYTNAAKECKENDAIELLIYPSVVAQLKIKDATRAEVCE